MSSPDAFSLTPFLEALKGAPGAVVLDLGCGTGRHARTLSLAGFRVCAVDSDVDALETGRSLYPREGVGRIDYCAGRAEALPFADATFDAVLCVDVLHWSTDAAAFEASWAEAWRVLRPGGRIFVRLRIRDLASSPEKGWFLADQAMLEALVERTGGEWIETVTREGNSAFFLVKKR